MLDSNCCMFSVAVTHVNGTKLVTKKKIKNKGTCTNNHNLSAVTLLDSGWRNDLLCGHPESGGAEVL